MIVKDDTSQRWCRPGAIGGKAGPGGGPNAAERIFAPSKAAARAKPRFEVMRIRAPEVNWRFWAFSATGQPALSGMLHSPADPSRAQERAGSVALLARRLGQRGGVDQ
jgi:hypothetical protein